MLKKDYTAHFLSCGTLKHRGGVDQDKTMLAASGVESVLVPSHLCG